LAEGTNYPDYGNFQGTTGDTKVMPIGSFQPNPLGLYDTAGNVAEITMDTFQLTVGGRLHGSHGGFVRKGGTYRDDFSSVLPGRRLETPFFDIEGPSKASDLGFRLVVSAPNVASGERLQSLKTAWISRGGGPLGNIDPMSKIDRLVEMAETEERKAAYESLRAIIKDSNQQAVRNQHADARDQWRSLLYTAYTIHMTGQRRKLAAAKITPLESLVKQLKEMYPTVNESQKGQIDKILANTQATMEAYKNLIADLDLTLDRQFLNYTNLVKEAVNGNTELLESQRDYVYQDFQGNDMFNQAMRECYRHVMRDYERGRTGAWNKIVLSELTSFGS
jgi:hypothetical protein